MRLGLVLLLLSGLGVTSALGQATHRSYGDCTCRYQGADFHEGETICANVSGKQVTMRCGRVLNNTSWKRMKEGCETNNLS